jgi:N-acetylmuramic acid 6-phosphate etherase
VQPRNLKLRARAIRILMAESGLDEEAAGKAFAAAGYDLQIALVISRTGCSRSQAEEALALTQGVVKLAIESLS